MVAYSPLCGGEYAHRRNAIAMERSRRIWTGRRALRARASSRYRERLPPRARCRCGGYLNEFRHDKSRCTRIVTRRSPETLRVSLFFFFVTRLGPTCTSNIARLERNSSCLSRGGHGESRSFVNRPPRGKSEFNIIVKIAGTSVRGVASKALAHRHGSVNFL